MRQVIRARENVIQNIPRMVIQAGHTRTAVEKFKKGGADWYRLADGAEVPADKFEEV